MAARLMLKIAPMFKVSKDHQQSDCADCILETVMQSAVAQGALDDTPETRSRLKKPLNRYCYIMIKQRLCAEFRHLLSICIVIMVATCLFGAIFCAVISGRLLSMGEWHPAIIYTLACLAFSSVFVIVLRRLVLVKDPLFLIDDADEYSVSGPQQVKPAS